MLPAHCQPARRFQYQACMSFGRGPCIGVCLRALACARGGTATSGVPWRAPTATARPSKIELWVYGRCTCTLSAAAPRNHPGPARAAPRAGRALGVCSALSSSRCSCVSSRSSRSATTSASAAAAPSDVCAPPAAAAAAAAPLCAPSARQAPPRRSSMCGSSCASTGTSHAALRARRSLTTIAEPVGRPHRPWHPARALPARPAMHRAAEPAEGLVERLGRADRAGSLRSVALLRNGHDRHAPLAHELDLQGKQSGSPDLLLRAGLRARLCAGGQCRQSGSMTCRIRMRTCVMGMCSSEPTSAGAHSARASAPAAKKPAACEAMMPSAWYKLSRTCARARGAPWAHRREARLRPCSRGTQRAPLCMAWCTTCGLRGRRGRLQTQQDDVVMHHSLQLACLQSWRRSWRSSQELCMSITATAETGQADAQLQGGQSGAVAVRALCRGAMAQSLTAPGPLERRAAQAEPFQLRTIMHLAQPGAQRAGRRPRQRGCLLLGAPQRLHAHAPAQVLRALLGAHVQRGRCAGHRLAALRARPRPPLSALRRGAGLGLRKMASRRSGTARPARTGHDPVWRRLGGESGSAWVVCRRPVCAPAVSGSVAAAGVARHLSQALSSQAADMLMISKHMFVCFSVPTTGALAPAAPTRR